MFDRIIGTHPSEEIVDKFMEGLVVEGALDNLDMENAIFQ